MKGGLVTQRHNEIRDALGDFSSLALNQVRREPTVTDAEELSESPALIADLSIRGVWVPQAEALFDVRVVDTHGQSYLDRSPLDVLSAAEVEKKENTNKPVKTEEHCLHHCATQMVYLKERQCIYQTYG